MIDELLIKLAKDRSNQLSDKDELEIDEDTQIKRVAFDIFKVENDPYENLWLMEERDGKKFLVRASNPQFGMDEDGDWSAVNDYEKRNVTLKYKDIPIARFSSESYSFTPDEVSTFKSALLDRVNSDHEFVKEMLDSQPTTMKEAVSAAFPELNKLIKG